MPKISTEKPRYVVRETKFKHSPDSNSNRLIVLYPFCFTITLTLINCVGLKPQFSCVSPSFYVFSCTHIIEASACTRYYSSWYFVWHSWTHFSQRSQLGISDFPHNLEPPLTFIIQRVVLHEPTFSISSTTKIDLRVETIVHIAHLPLSIKSDDLFLLR